MDISLYDADQKVSNFEMPFDLEKIRIRYWASDEILRLNDKSIEEIKYTLIQIHKAHQISSDTFAIDEIFLDSQTLYAHSKTIKQLDTPISIYREDSGSIYIEDSGYIELLFGFKLKIKPEYLLRKRILSEADSVIHMLPLEKSKESYTRVCCKVYFV